jgi:phage regulator Rha-like protein
MNALNTNSTLTMTSREIAELTGKEHKNVLADIRKMLEELVYDSADYSAQYIDPTGRTLPCFTLPKDLTITLVSGYNVQMRYAITKRWMELEARQAPALPQTFAEALRLAADKEEQRAALAHQVEVMKPAAAIGTAVGNRKRTTVLDFSRKLPGVNTMQVQNKLCELGHMRKRKGELGRRLQAGRCSGISLALLPSALRDCLRSYPLRLGCHGRLSSRTPPWG